MSDTRRCPACSSQRTEILCLDSEVLPRTKDDRNVPMDYIDIFQCNECSLIWCLPHDQEQPC